MPKYWPVILATCVGVAALISGLQAGSDQLDKWLLASRWTARFSFLFFLVVFTASSMVKLWPNDTTRSVMRNRKWWGLAFATTHTIHLYALLTFVYLLPVKPPIMNFTHGIAAYIMIYAMALTSWPWAYKALGKNWKRLHKTGIYVIWFAFAVAYSLRLATPDQRVTGIIFGMLVFGALGLRIAAWSKGKAKRQAVA